MCVCVCGHAMHGDAFGKLLWLLIVLVVGFEVTVLAPRKTDLWLVVCVLVWLVSDYHCFYLSCCRALCLQSCNLSFCLDFTKDALSCALSLHHLYLIDSVLQTTLALHASLIGGKLKSLWTNLWNWLKCYMSLKTKRREDIGSAVLADQAFSQHVFWALSKEVWYQYIPCVTWCIGIT